MQVLIEALGYQIGFGFAVAKLRPELTPTVPEQCPGCEECKPPSPVGFA